MVNMRKEIDNMKKYEENKYIEDKESIVVMRKRKYNEIMDDDDAYNSMNMDEDEYRDGKPCGKKAKGQATLLEVDKERHMIDLDNASPHEEDNHNHAE